jgi:arylsulfatase A-like enzyme
MRQHVLYITVDSVRADRMGYLGYNRPTTPTLDGLADDGTVWTRAMASGIPTYFSFKSLLGGVYPLSHTPELGLPREVPALAETFRQLGYQTAGFNAGNPWLTHAEGYDRGFETFRDFLTEGQDGYGIAERLRELQRFVPEHDLVRDWAGRVARTGCALTGQVPLEPAERMTADATEWLTDEADADRPTFLWIHYMDPHYPWVPPAALLERFRDEPLSRLDIGRLWHTVAGQHEGTDGQSISDRDLDAIDALYDAEIRRTDDAIDDLLTVVDDTLGLSETVVAVAGDHGTELADHGGFSHAPRSLYDEVVRVPLLLRGPGVPSTTITEPVSLVDVPPTLLDYAVPEREDAIPDAFEGTSLFVLEDDPTFTNVTYGFSPATRDVGTDEMLTACLDWPWKLVDREGADERELYHLERDPEEQRNLATRRSTITDELRSRIENHRAETRRCQRTVAEKYRIRDRVAMLRREGAI